MNVGFHPTLLESAKANPSKAQKLDGVSILANWTNPKAIPKRDAIYWHYPLEKPHFLSGISGGAIRTGDWKLIEFFDTGKVELFFFAEDVGEKKQSRRKTTEVARTTAKTVGTAKERPKP